MECGYVERGSPAKLGRDAPGLPAAWPCHDEQAPCVRGNGLELRAVKGGGHAAMISERVYVDKGFLYGAYALNARRDRPSYRVGLYRRELLVDPYLYLDVYERADIM